MGITSIFIRVFRIIMPILLVSSSLFGQDENELIDTYLKNEQIKNNWLTSDIKDYFISDRYFDKSTNLTHTYIQQKHNHIQVYNAISVFLIRDNKVLYFKSGITSQLQKKVNAEKPIISSTDAIHFALLYLKKNENVQPELISYDASLNKYIYNAPAISTSPVTVQLVYRESGEKFLLSWNVSIELKNEPHWWNIRIDALKGEYIDKNDFTVECKINDDSESSESISSNTSSYASAFFSVPEYNIFPFPLEAPSFGNRTLLSDPSDPVASPYGWHDINGVVGEEFTITRGNNVHAYEDANNDDLPGYSPDAGTGLSFNYPFTAYAAPLTNQDASLTNLFYTNNAIHDYLYPLGFNETAGNFQQNNYGSGGIGNDYVKAEGFDGSGTNNANFSTPPDGFSGRMQMYLWNGNQTICTNLNVSSTTYSGPMSVGIAAFSPAASVTANLILVNDGVGTVTDACTAITNNIIGKVALIDRGTCNYISKAQAAQAAGAVGVIIANNVSGAAPAMTGTPTLSIPCVSVSQANGNTLKSSLLSGVVSVTINTCLNNQIDGSFDNGIVAHEYGHGLSNRLTGGPSQAGCLSNNENGGEGWSDWLALMMTIEPGDQGANARGIGTYAKGQPVTGAGIRRYPYSTNMSINPQTYGNLALNTEIHAIGEIWCDAVWDMSWSLIDQYGFNNNPFNTTAGNNIAMRLVLEGMKLQPCGPGFLDSRDAILLADAILYNNAHRCLIWQAFARRGMGSNASQGSANIAGDETEGFNLPAFCLPPTQKPVAAFASDVSGISCGGTIKFTDQSVQAFEWLWNFGDQSTSTLQNPSHIFTTPGTYSVKLIVTNPLGSDSIIHSITVSPNFSVDVTATPEVVCNGDEVNLAAVATGATNRSYTVSGIPYAPLSGTGTSVTLADDAMSSVQPIGFTFNFFGQNYTSFYLSSNGFITFSPMMPATPVYGEAIPSIADPDNFIALSWNDLNPQNAGSSISYFLTGSAPSRKLVVRYSTSHYGGTTLPFVVQAILYETTNVIEIHTTIISDASAYDPSATTTQGVENADGSRGVPVPGRNGAIFSASNDAFRFTPFIPYSYSWFPGNLDGPIQSVTPSSSGSYSVNVSDGTSCVVTYNTPSITVYPNCLPLNVKLFLEGYYLGNSMMQPVLLNQAVLNATTFETDTVIVELHDDNDPALILDATSAILNTDGTLNCMFHSASPLTSYWLVVRHRNSIETWSSNTIFLNTSGNGYDFTTAISNAYADNQKDVFNEGIWSMISGDLNQDGFVDIFDFPQYDLDNQNFVNNVYALTDLNGDGFVDIFDFPLYDMNNQNFIMSIHP